MIKMELFPMLEIGWLNGWIFLAIHVLIQALFMASCPKEVKVRLLDRKGWKKSQRITMLVGKISSLINIILIILTPLKIGSIDFIVGIILFSIGIIGLSTAILNFKKAPLNTPITKGLYKISRNPQMVSIYIIFLGYSFVIGSLLSIVLLIISISCSHFSILGEEKRLTEQYGESYLEYKKKIPRYFLFF